VRREKKGEEDKDEDDGGKKNQRFERLSPSNLFSKSKKPLSQPFFSPFFFTHPDAQEWAGNGSMVGAIKGATRQEPTVVGKPAEFMLADIAKKFNLKRSQICMVGDRLDTDILFGSHGGLATMLVLSGVTTESALLSPENTIHPNYYTGSLADLLAVKGETVKA